MNCSIDLPCANKDGQWCTFSGHCLSKEHISPSEQSIKDELLWHFRIWNLTVDKGKTPTELEIIRKVALQGGRYM